MEDLQRKILEINPITESEISTWYTLRDFDEYLSSLERINPFTGSNYTKEQLLGILEIMSNVPNLTGLIENFNLDLDARDILSEIMNTSYDENSNIKISTPFIVGLLIEQKIYKNDGQDLTTSKYNKDKIIEDFKGLKVGVVEQELLQIRSYLRFGKTRRRRRSLRRSRRLNKAKRKVQL